MKKKLSDLSIEEFQNLVAETIKDTMEDYMEEILALSSQEYLDSIQEAREDLQMGRVEKLKRV